MADDCCNPEKEKKKDWIWYVLLGIFVLGVLYFIFAGNSGATTGLEHAPDMVGGC